MTDIMSWSWIDLRIPNVCLALRIQVCPKKWINPPYNSYCFLGWDWDHQNLLYNREGIGILRVDMAICNMKPVAGQYQILSLRPCLEAPLGIKKGICSCSRKRSGDSFFGHLRVYICVYIQKNYTTSGYTTSLTKQKKKSDHSWSDFFPDSIHSPHLSKYPWGNRRNSADVSSPRYQRNPIVPQDAEIFKWQLLSFVSHLRLFLKHFFGGGQNGFLVGGFNPSEKY